MIQNAIVLRTSDGLTLASSTDERNQDFVQEAHKKYLKLLAKNLKGVDNRCYIKLGVTNLYFIKNLDINTYITIVDARYPITLAVCLLKEIQNEFSGKYDSRDVAKMRRPYSCVEFNEDIHKIIKRYNRPQSLTTRIDLQEVNKELQLHPLKELKLSDLEMKPFFPALNNVNIDMGNNQYLGVGPPAPIVSLWWHHYILIVLSFLTALLSLFRFFEFNSSTLDDEISFPSSFALHFITSIVQICFLIKPKFRAHKYKMYLNFIAALYSIYLIEIYTEIELILFNFIVAISLHIATLRRSRVPKKPQAMV